MIYTYYFKKICEEIHTIVLATKGDDGFPVTSVIDIMLYDEEGLYFLTAKGKDLYSRLKKCQVVSISGFRGKNTLDTFSISLRGKVEDIGRSRLDEIFEKNPYMYEIYPKTESRQALTVFRIYDGKGEYFDLSRKPIFRERFFFGNSEYKSIDYMVNHKCNACEKCIKVCPQDCILMDGIKATIIQKNCLHCGICEDVCPCNAIIRRYNL